MMFRAVPNRLGFALVSAFDLVLFLKRGLGFDPAIATIQLLNMSPFLLRADDAKALANKESSNHVAAGGRHHIDAVGRGFRT